MSKIRSSLGVYQNFDGSYTAEIGVKVIGEYKTEYEAATAYNDYITKSFKFPIYNKRGDSPEPEVEKITEQIPVAPKETNKVLNAFLAAQNIITIEEPIEVTLEQEALATLRNIE